MLTLLDITWPQLLDPFLVLVVMLNPFLMSIYLIELFKKLDRRRFLNVLIRAFCISTVVFIVVGLSGDYFFQHILRVRFSAFLIFGGALFAIISIKQMLQGEAAIEMLRGPVEYISGGTTLPFMIGPGTISASIYAGSQLGQAWGSLIILAAVIVCAVSLFILKCLFDWIAKRHVNFAQSYIDIAGRMGALVMGAIAVEMIIRGIETL